MTEFRVAMGIPYYRSVEGPTLLSCMDLAARSAEAGIAMLPIGTAGCYIEDNRNGCVQYAMNTGIDFTHLLWIDGDMIFPGNALLRLLAAGKDIVGANYRTRTPPYKHAGVYKDRSGAPLSQGGLHQMEQMPTGLLLTRFDIYRKMGYPWFKPGLHSEPRDDIYFCRRAVEMGYEIWCDHDLTREVQHITVQQLPWFAPEQLVQVTGAEINNAESAKAAQERAAHSAEKFMAADRSAA
jgi:hypothetical protein